MPVFKYESLYLGLLWVFHVNKEELNGTGFIYERKTFQCDHCDFKSKYRSSITNHMQSVHDGILFECDQCDFKSKSEKWKQIKFKSTFFILCFFKKLLHRRITLFVDSNKKHSFQNICLELVPTLRFQYFKSRKKTLDGNLGWRQGQKHKTNFFSDP